MQTAAKFLAAAFLLFVLTVSIRAGSIPAAEAAGRVGQEATVTGRVVRVATLGQSTGQPTIMDLDRAFPNAPLQVVVFEKDVAALGGDLRKAYEGKSVEVSGTITKFGNTPQIVVSRPEQLRVPGAGPAPAEPESAAPVVEEDKPLPPEPQAAVDSQEKENSEDASEPPAGIGSAVFGKSGDDSSRPPNLLKNGDFADGKSAWIVERGTDVAEIDGGAALRVRLSPKEVVRVSQKITSRIPRDARQYQAVFQARLDPDARLEKPLMLWLGESPGYGSKLPRPVAPGGAWREVKWTRTADLKGHSPLIFTIEAGPGEGDLWIRDAYLFAHPDYKDKATWKVSDG